MLEVDSSTNAQNADALEIEGEAAVAAAESAEEKQHNLYTKPK